MIKFPGIGGAAAGVLGEAGGIGARTIGTMLRSPNGGASQTRQENSDLSKVVEDLLHDKLMDKMGGGAANALGGLPLGGHSPMAGAMKENGDLKKLLGDLLQQGAGAARGAAQPQQQSPLQTENDDLKKLLGDLLKSLIGGQGAAQPQQSGLQGENQDLMKLLSDLLKGGGTQGAGHSDESADPASMLENVLKQNKQMKSALGAMQQTMQSLEQLSAPLAMTQQMMTQGA